MQAQEAALLSAALQRALAALAAPPGPPRERVLNADTSPFELVHVLADLGGGEGGPNLTLPTHPEAQPWF